MEQIAGIEPAQSAWEADVLPLNYRCTLRTHYKRKYKKTPMVWSIFIKWWML